MPETIHLHPTGPLAERVLLPGDPGRALRLAQEMLDEPKMFNHNRGLWGYTGTAHDGVPLTIQSTGMGGLSMAIVAAELIDLGARRLVRAGTCAALDPALELGRLLVATHAISDDGASRALGAGEHVASSPSLLAGLLEACDSTVASGPVVSTLFALAERRDVEAGCVLAVTDQLAGEHVRIDLEALHEAEIHLGQLGLAGFILAA